MKNVNPSSKDSFNESSYPTGKKEATGAVISEVETGSVAYKKGLRAGMRIVSLDGKELADILDWMWLSDGLKMRLVVEDTNKKNRILTLRRKIDEPWGISFSENVFDGVKTCKNACLFCFMSMLPENMRSSLYLRDDDYRLSFLQGNFVTLTNISDEEIERIVNMRLAPLHVSLHAVNSDVRRYLMGKNHQRGIDVLNKLLQEGIEVHGQIVLCPGINDGKILEETLSWALKRPKILSLGIVPVGYTKYQSIFKSSFTDPSKAREVIELVDRYQKISFEKYGEKRIQIADEFYVCAYPEDLEKQLPEAEQYSGYPQFYDGIGMLRSFLDDWKELVPSTTPTAGSASDLLQGTSTAPTSESPATPAPTPTSPHTTTPTPTSPATPAPTPESPATPASTTTSPHTTASTTTSPITTPPTPTSPKTTAPAPNLPTTFPKLASPTSSKPPILISPPKQKLIVAGTAFKRFFDPLLKKSSFANNCVVIGADNESFGGNVDVCGLLTGKDMINALLKFKKTQEISDLNSYLIAIPKVAFNDEGFTLDDMSPADIEQAISARACVLSYFASELFDFLSV